MRKHLLLLLALLVTEGATAQWGTITPLHVKGNQLVDTHDNPVVLHGVMDTPSPYFNNWRWGNACNDNTTTACINYFNQLFTAMTDTKQGAYCNLFRLHLDCCWTNDNSVWAEGFTRKNDKTYDPSGNEVGGEADISHFSPERLKKYMTSVYFPIAQRAKNHGMYVIMRPPGVCPGNLKVGDYYQQYLLTVWDIVTQNPNVRRNAGWLSIELANEPVSLRNANNQSDAKAMHDYFQPIVDKIRENGFTGIIWVPGTGWQSSYADYAKYPIEGYNIGYAVHDYTGWYGCSDESVDRENNLERSKQNLIAQFHNQVPVVDTNPIVITEIDWSPKNPGTGHYNEHGEWVESNLGTWSTGSTSKWGECFKALHDYYGNISMTLSGSHCYFDVDTYLQTKQVVPAFNANPEGCGKACFDWYAEWAQEKQPRPEFQRVWTADQGNGTYINPIINADAPDPDIIRVDDWYYLATTTFYHFPGVTIFKSRDLVNWEFCCNPLEKIADSDEFNLKNGKNHYAGGQWAPSLKYYKGQFYLNFICFGNDGGDFMLTTRDPEGKWTMKKVDGWYYDSGFLFDDGPNGTGNVYVAHGIDRITVSQVDMNRDFKSVKDVVVSENGNGLEGSHMYHIGDYYYIYATYGGTEGSQTIFRAKDPFGPYEEHNGRVFEKQKIHQGGLVQTQTGEWWTILFRDAGAIGRIPYLEPVQWVDGWPVIGNNGTDVSAQSKGYAKPDVGRVWPQTYLATNDAFAGSRIGVQWGWNHNPDNSAWALKDGWLHLATTGISDDLWQARNSLSQRILGYSAANTAQTKVQDSYGTIKMAIGGMKDGDVAGLAVFQDPYAFIAVRQDNGVKRLYARRSEYENWGNVTPASELTGDVIEADTIYLRAVANYGTSKARFYYSLDNKKWTRWGIDLEMRFTLKVFVGQRFYLFNYATQQNGGFVDIDWFTTESTPFSEDLYYAPGTLESLEAEDFELASLEADPKSVTVAVGQSLPQKFVAVSTTGHKMDVTKLVTVRSNKPAVADFENGMVIGKAVGSATLYVSYTDDNEVTKSTRLTVKVTLEDAVTAPAAKPTVVTTEYYTVDGRRISAPARTGISIVRQRMSDSTVQTHKVRR